MTTATTTTNDRIHLLKLTARNIKAVREVVIDEVGEILEIRGDSGQGKTTILEAIEGGLRGLDPSMVHQGEDAAEIILELDVARIQRIIKSNGGRETLTVIDPKSGKPVDKAKEFLKSLFPDATAFRPLEFVRLGGGDSAGKTQRLRQQRNMLLESMPVRLQPEGVARAIVELGDDVFKEASGIPVDDIDFSQHGLAVCGSLEKLFYDARKAKNAAADEAEERLKILPLPKILPPKSSADELQKKFELAQEAYYKADAIEKNLAKAATQRKELRAFIDEESKELSPKSEIETAKGNLTSEIDNIQKRLEKLRQEIATLEKDQAEKKSMVREADDLLDRHKRLDRSREELARLEGETNGEPLNVEALKKAMDEAKADHEARVLQDAYDRSAATATTARDRAKIYDSLVQLFRDTLPKKIVEEMNMPVPGLSIQEGVVTVNDVPLHQLGTSEQIKVAVLIAAQLNPRAGFVTIDQAESLGSKDRLALAEAAKEHNLQLILTYVDPNAKPGPGVLVMDGGRAVT